MPDTSPETQALRAALEAANRREQAANARANEATQHAHTATQRGLAAELAAYDNAIEQTKAAQSIAQQKWTSLQQEGNFEAAGDAMREMTEAASRLSQLANQRNVVANQAEQIKNAPPPPPNGGDPLAGYSPQERDWINNNPKYLEDRDFNAKVNAAAEYAMRVAGHTRNTPQYFESIERSVYPERFQDGDGGYQDERSPYSDTGDQPVDEGRMEQRHNIELPYRQPEREVPVMRTNGDGGERGGGERVEQPQERAVGRGGAGLSATAAPPSRRMAEAGRNVTNGRVTLTQDEMDAAIRLGTDIEGDKTNGWSRDQFAEWYYMMAHHPSHQNTRRRSWVRDAIIA